MFERSAFISTTIIIIVSLSGCGGGSSGLSSSSQTLLIQDPEELQALADREPPSNSGSEDIGGQLDRIKDIAVDHPHTGTLLVTVFQEPFEHVDQPLDPINCRSTVCITPDGRVRLTDFEFRAAEYQNLMTRHDIPVIYFQKRDASGLASFIAVSGSTSNSRSTSNSQGGRNDVPATVGYGAWLKHSAFATLAGPFHTRVRDDGFSVATLAAFYSGAQQGGEYIPRTGAFSFGNRTEEAIDDASESATWKGVMTGIDTVFDHPIQGDATLAVEMNRPYSTVDVTFSRIFDLETRTQLTRPALLPETSPSEALVINFPDLPLTEANGFGRTWPDRNNPNWSIEGWFYGPNHAEAGGVFQHLEYEIVGAFGVRLSEE